MKYLALLSFVVFLTFGCKKDSSENIPQEPNFEFVDIEVILPSGANLDISNATITSLGASSELDERLTGQLPHNNDGIELAFLIDENDNLLLSGFITDTKRKISVETTTEVLLYYALDYYLLTPSARQGYLDKVQQIPDFNALVSNISDLFNQDPLMYMNASYLDLIYDKVNEISRIASNEEDERIFIDGDKTKSGITVSSVDQSQIILQNSFPRRTRVVAYKKSYYDNQGNLTEVPEYWNKPIVDFKFEAGKKFEVDGIDVGSSIAGAHASMASVDLATSSDPIDLPVNPPSEFSVEYQLVVIGSGTENIIERNLSAYEQQIQEELNVEAYALDYLLPTIMDIGGNKDLLPPLGSDKESALLDVVRPVLESNPNVLAAIKKNDFKSASETLLPELYGDIRLANELRELLKGVYNVISNNGNSPNTFIQSNELTEIGYDRFKIISAAMYKNMDLAKKSSIEMLRTDARAVESWEVNSIDADIAMVPQSIDLCLGEATEIRASILTFYEPEVEEFEYHWKTSNKFSGRVQDINGDPTNFGSSIVTKSNIVSYISAALDSELGSGNNFETVSVEVFTKNKATGELTEVGSDEMTVDNKKGCVSFYASFTKLVPIDTAIESSLLCNFEPEFRVSEQYFVATFKAVEGANGYKGQVKKKDGTFAAEFNLNSGSIREIGDGLLEYRLRVGSIDLFFTCNYDSALVEQEERMERLDEIGHQGIQITPIF